MARPSHADFIQRFGRLGTPPPAGVTWQQTVAEQTPVPGLLNQHTDWTALRNQLSRQFRCYLDLYHVDDKQCEFFKAVVATHPYGKEHHAIKALVYEILILHVQNKVTVKFSDVEQDGFDWIHWVHVPASSRAFMDAGYFPSLAFYDGLSGAALSKAVRTDRGVVRGTWKSAGFNETLLPSGDLYIAFQPIPRIPVVGPPRPLSLPAPAEMPAAPRLGQDSAFAPAQPRPKPFALADASGGQ